MHINKVVSYKCLPSKLPVWQTVTAFLLLDRLNVPQWVWGAVGCFYLLAWIICLFAVINQKQVDIFEKDVL